MSAGAWVPALNERDLEEGAPQVASVKGLSIVLIRVGGQAYALRNRCAHMACTLAGGRLDGYTLQCPCHEWRYDIRTGEFLAAKEIAIRTYPCKAQDGKILINVEDQ